MPPPKQKEAKKGPTYKAMTPLKDIVPATVKQPPRETKPLKTPEIQPENADKNAQQAAHLPVLFEEWPAEQALKAHDFGLHSEAKFEDKHHQRIDEYLRREWGEHRGDQNSFIWKSITDQPANDNEHASRSQQSSSGAEQQAASSSEALEGAEKLTEKILNVVIETYLREETEQEVERRKKQEAEKAEKNAKDKKKGKKEEPKEEGPLQISDVKMSDVIVKRNMCPSGIWIGSQLQIIKIRDLRDINSDEPVWKKVYPQQNGVPQLTKSGKYWVKLHYMGKSVKIQVDDRVPVSMHGRQLFPRSQKGNEKWTFIVSKALIKLFCLSNPHSSLVGSGMIINALTGLITENIKISNFKDWEKICDFMNDEHYLRKDIMVNCYASQHGKQAPSNVARSRKDIHKILALENSTFKKKSRRLYSQAELIQPAHESENEEDEKFEQQHIDAGVISGYAYCLGDYFQNGNFNMAFSKNKSVREQKLKEAYLEMSKVVLTHKTREQKLEHRRKKKQIKEKLQIEERKRLQLISQPVVDHHFVKLLGNVHISCEYAHHQILLAKRCVLNGLERPPNYDMPVEEKKNQEKEKEGDNLASTQPIKKQEEPVKADLEDFSSVQNAVELQHRAQHGVWIKDSDLLSVFDELQFFYNPNSFKNKSVEVVHSKNTKQFTIDENKEILVLLRKGNEHLEQQTDETIRLLWGFAFQQSKTDMCEPYCKLQKFDFESYRTASTTTTLDRPLSSTFLTLSNNNHMFRIYSISRGRYAYWISSDADFKLLSVADYLTEYENYTPKLFTIEYPALERKNCHTLARLKVKYEGEDPNTLLLKIKNCPKEIEKYLSYRIVESPTDGVYTQEEQEGVITNKSEHLHLVYEYSKISLSPGKSYCIVIEGYPAESIPDGSIELLALSKLPLAYLEQAEQIQPYRVVEKYTPNKYAVILKQRLFCSNTVNASISLKIFLGEEGQPVVADKKNAKKGAKDEPAFEIIEKQMTQKRLINVKLIKNGTLVYFARDYNQVILPNIELEKSKDNNNYYLEASFDLRQWPEASQANELTSKVYWSAQVSAEDTIVFVKDTLQQEKEKQTRKSWEDKQPGRAEKAKKSRQRFLLELKLERGENLTEEQMQIVNAPRLTRKKQLEEEKKNEEKKGVKGAKKQEKKGKDKKQEVVEEKQQEQPLPKSSDNYTKQIRQFIKNLEDFKIKRVELAEGQQARVRTGEQLNSIKQGALMAKENRCAQIVRNIEMRQVQKIKEKQKKDELTIMLENLRNGFNSEWKQYLKWRMEGQQKDKAKQQKEKLLVEIIRQEKVTLLEPELTKIINQYRTIDNYNQKLADVADMVRKNLKISSINDKLSTAADGWEVQGLKAIMQEISNDKVEGLNPETMTRVTQILQEAAKNPNIVAEKQAQLKKNKKGGKK